MEGGGGELAYIRLVMGAQASVSPGLCPDTQGPPRVPEGQHGGYCPYTPTITTIVNFYSLLLLQLG